GRVRSLRPHVSARCPGERAGARACPPLRGRTGGVAGTHRPALPIARSARRDRSASRQVGLGPAGHPPSPRPRGNAGRGVLRAEVPPAQLRPEGRDPPVGRGPGELAVGWPSRHGTGRRVRDRRGRPEGSSTTGRALQDSSRSPQAERRQRVAAPDRAGVESLCRGAGLSDLVLALDYGGTKLSAAIASEGAGPTVSGDGWLALECVQKPAGADGAFDRATMLQLANKLLAGRTPKAVGVSFGGPVDFPNGEVRLSHHVPGW